MAAGKTVEREFQNCCDWLADNSEGRSPTATYVANMSPFSKLFMNNTDGFCVWNIDEPVEMEGHRVRTQQLQGRDALTARFAHCASPQGGEPSSHDWKEFEPLDGCSMWSRQLALTNG